MKHTEPASTPGATEQSLPCPGSPRTRRALLRDCLRYGLLAAMGAGIYLAARRAGATDCRGVCSTCGRADTCRLRPDTETGSARAGETAP